jgi:hypothetical protein
MSLRRRNRRVDRSRAHPEDYLTLDELGKELDTYSAAISTQVRTINLGVLGLSWLMLLGDEKVAAVASNLSRPVLLGICLVCLLALVVDLSHYLLGKRAVDATFDAAARSEDRVAAYDLTSFSYRAAFWCYRLKLVLALVGAATLIVLVGRALI